MIQAKNPLLRELFEQLRFAPAEQKQKHLAAAEKLLLTLNAVRQYPFDFVVFRLTGYRRRSDDCQQLIEGKALLEDLRIWTRQLGSRIEKPAEQQGEAVLSVSELAKRFSVADKTIRRWREKHEIKGVRHLFERKLKGSDINLFSANFLTAFSPFLFFLI